MFEERQNYLVISIILALTTVHAKSLQLCLILCDLMDYRLTGSSVHGFLQATQNTGLGCCALLLGIFPTQGSNPHLLCLLHLLVCSLPLMPPKKPIHAAWHSLHIVIKWVDEWKFYLNIAELACQLFLDPECETSNVNHCHVSKVYLSCFLAFYFELYAWPIALKMHIKNKGLDSYSLFTCAYVFMSTY